MPGSRRLGVAGLLAALCGAPALAANPIAPFSALPVGPVSDSPWSARSLPDVEPARFEIVESAGEPVLRVEADAAASSLALPLAVTIDNGTRLAWRWKINNVVESGDITSKEGDDFAARLYVFFDLPLTSLTLGQRTKVRLARWLYDDKVPTAALCYVWGNKEPVGTSAWNAYTDRVRVIVLRNADDPMATWQAERRDLAADFEQAFGLTAPPISGIAVAADTDQTRERVTAWFGDIRLEQSAYETEQAP